MISNKYAIKRSVNEQITFKLSKSLFFNMCRNDCNSRGVKIQQCYMGLHDT